MTIHAVVVGVRAAEICLAVATSPRCLAVVASLALLVPIVGRERVLVNQPGLSANTRSLRRGSSGLCSLGVQSALHSVVADTPHRCFAAGTGWRTAEPGCHLRCGAHNACGSVDGIVHDILQRRNDTNLRQIAVDIT